MKIGIPKEIKANEHRVGMTPAGVRELARHGHALYVESNAGAGIGAADAAYTAAGATVLPDADAVFSAAEMIVKVKEPQAVEIARLKPHHVLFTYLHLAPDPKQAEGLMASGCTAIAYETITDAKGVLPLLRPMSEVAGRMSIQVGALSLERHMGGAGILIGGVPGVPPADVVVLGGGTVGVNAARIALGMGARVTILDKSPARLIELDDLFGGRVVTLFATQDAIAQSVERADLVIGAVLVAGASAPKLVDRALLRKMSPGSVVVDVAIDQGGCFETSRPTTHKDPTYIEEGIVHYCVANMPGAVPRTSTAALTNATLPYVVALADKGVFAAMQADPGLAQGLNVHAGTIAHPAVAEALGKPCVLPEGLRI